MKCWNNFWVIVHLLLVHVSNTFDIKSFRTLHINAKKSTWTLIVRKSPSAEIIRYLIHDTCWKPIQFFCVFVHCTLQNVMLLQGEKHKRRRNASSGKRTYIPFWPTYFLEFAVLDDGKALLLLTTSERKLSPPQSNKTCTICAQKLKTWPVMCHYRLGSPSQAIQ